MARSAIRKSDVRLLTGGTSAEETMQGIQITRREQLSLLLESLIESLADGVVALDCTGRLLHLSDSLREPAGESAVPGFASDESLAPAILDRLRAEALQIGAGRSRSFELEWNRPEIGVTTYRVIGVAGRIPGASSEPWSQPVGDRILTLFAFRDRTREAALEEELARAGKLAALGQMAGTVAHELRNPLGAIEGFATLLKRDLAGQDGPLHQVDRILRGVEGANRIVQDLLEYCRPIDLRLEPISIEGLLAESLSALEASSRWSDRIEVDLNIDSGLAPGWGDRRLLLQVLANLYSNAIDAMSGAGTLSIRARAVGPARIPERLRLVIRDTGCGLSAEDVARIFAPFYTTKPGGTGLGLALVRRIVEAHRGHVHVVSAPGRGTSVVLDLMTAGMEATVPADEAVTAKTESASRPRRAYEEAA